MTCWCFWVTTQNNVSLSKCEKHKHVRMQLECVIHCLPHTTPPCTSIELIFKGKPPKDIKCILNLKCLSSGYCSFFRTCKVKRARKKKEEGEGDSGVAQETIIGGSMVSTYQTVPPVQKDGKKRTSRAKIDTLHTQYGKPYKMYINSRVEFSELVKASLYPVPWDGKGTVGWQQLYQ